MFCDLNQCTIVYDYVTVYFNGAYLPITETKSKKQGQGCKKTLVAACVQFAGIGQTFTVSMESRIASFLRLMYF